MVLEVRPFHTRGVYSYRFPWRATISPSRYIYKYTEITSSLRSLIARVGVARLTNAAAALFFFFWVDENSVRLFGILGYIFSPCLDFVNHIVSHISSTQDFLRNLVILSYKFSSGPDSGTVLPSIHFMICIPGSW